MQIGVLALQGAFREHLGCLRTLGVQGREVRLPNDLPDLDGLILPGGESTTMVRLLNAHAFWEPLRAFHARGGSLWGTCAGAILLAREVGGQSPALPPQPSLGLIDMTIERNAFGRQRDSFTTLLPVQGMETPFPAVFIRAPVITRLGAGAQSLADIGGQSVLVRQGRVLASAFHPELTNDPRLHELFLAGVEAQRPAHRPA